MRTGMRMGMGTGMGTRMRMGMGMGMGTGTGPDRNGELTYTSWRMTATVPRRPSLILDKKTRPMRMPSAKLWMVSPMMLFHAREGLTMTCHQTGMWSEEVKVWWFFFLSWLLQKVSSMAGTAARHQSTQLHRRTECSQYEICHLVQHGTCARTWPESQYPSLRRRQPIEALQVRHASLPRRLLAAASIMKCQALLRSRGPQNTA